MPHSIDTIYGVSPSWQYIQQKSPEVWAQLENISTLQIEQAAKLSTLRDRLTAVAYACTTRKQLLEALPEFESYLPAEEAKAAKNLPAVANVLSDFVKAGWPKNQPKMPKVTP